MRFGDRERGDHAHLGNKKCLTFHIIGADCNAVLCHRKSLWMIRQLPKSDVAAYSISQQFEKSCIVEI